MAYFNITVQYPEEEAMGMPPQQVAVWGEGPTLQLQRNAANSAALDAFRGGKVSVGGTFASPPAGMQVVGGPPRADLTSATQATADVGAAYTPFQPPADQAPVGPLGPDVRTSYGEDFYTGGGLAPGFVTAGGAKTLGYDPNYAAKLREEPLFTPFKIGPEQQYGEQFYLDPRRMPGSEIPGTALSNEYQTARNAVDAQIADVDARLATLNRSRRAGAQYQGTSLEQFDLYAPEIKAEIDKLTADRAFYGDQQKELISQEVPQTRFVQPDTSLYGSDPTGTGGGGPLGNVVSGGIIPDGGGAGFNSNEVLAQYGNQVPGMDIFLARLAATQGSPVEGIAMGVPDLPPELISAATRQVPVTDPNTGALIGYEYQTDPAVAAVVSLYQQRLVDASKQADRRGELALANISQDIAASENTSNELLAITSGTDAARVAQIRADADVAVAEATGTSQVDVATAVASRNVELEDLRIAHEEYMADALQLSQKEVADIEAAAVKDVASANRDARMAEATAALGAQQAQADVAIERINAATLQQADALEWSVTEKKALFDNQSASDQRMHAERMLEMKSLNQLAIERVNSELKVAEQHGMTAFDVANITSGSASNVARIEAQYGLDAEQIRADSAKNLAALSNWTAGDIAKTQAGAVGRTAEAAEFAATAAAGAVTGAATTQAEAAKEIAATTGATATEVAQIQADGATAVATAHGVSADYVADVMSGAQTGVAITQAGAVVDAAEIASEVQKYVADATGTSAENVATAYAGAQQTVGLAGAAAQVEASRAGLTPEQYMGLSGTLARGGLPIPERMQLGRIQYTGGLEAEPWRDLQEILARGGISPEQVLQQERLRATGGIMPTEYGELQLGLARGGLTAAQRLEEARMAAAPQVLSTLTGLLGDPSAVGTLQSLGGGLSGLMQPFGFAPPTTPLGATPAPLGATPTPLGTTPAPLATTPAQPAPTTQQGAATQQMAAGAFPTPSLSTLPRIPTMANLRGTSEEEKRRQQGFFAGRGVTPSLLGGLIRGVTPAGAQATSVMA